MTDFVISTNLIVFGMSTFTGGQTFDGQTIIDVDNAEALLVRKDGDTEDIFIVDTTNEAVRLASDDTFLAFGAASDAQMHRDAADIIAQRRGLNPQEWRLYDRFVSLSDYDRLAIYIGGGPPLKTIEFVAESTVANQGISIDIEARSGSSADGRLNLMVGSALLQMSTGSASLNTPFSITSMGSNSLNLSGFAVFGPQEGTAGVALKIDIAGQGAAAFEDSHSIDLIGAGENANRATWRTFVDVINVGGDSIWTLQDDKNGGGFVTNFSITDDGGFNFPLPLPSHAIGAAIDLSSQLTLSGDYFSLLSGGTTASRFKTENRLTGASGQTVGIFQSWFGGNIRTQTATENVANIATVSIDEPNILDNLTGDITHAQTLLITGAPTEGESNFAFRILAGDIEIDNSSAFLFDDGGGGSLSALSVAPTNRLEIGLSGTPWARINLYSTLVTLASNLVVSGAGPHAIGQSAVDDNWQLLLAGNFTSGGSSNESAKLRIEGALTGASGDTAGMVGTYFDATFVTQTETENIANISQCRFDGANITDNLTGDITNAQTLFITASPTAGEANWTIRSTALAPSIFQGLQLAIGRTTLEDWHQVVVSGAFTSGGSASEADKFKVESSLTGVAGDSTLNGAFFGASIVTQTATETINDIAQVKIFDPSITDNLTGVITNAHTLLLTGSPTEGVNNYALRSTGPARSMFIGLPFTIGTNIPTDVWQVQIRGNFTSGGTSNRAAKFEIEESVIGVSGDTVFLGGALFAARVTTQTVAEVVTDVFQVRIEEPIITVGAGSSITNAQTLLIVAAPTEGVNNYALRVVSGDVILGGNLAVSGAGPHAIAGTPSGIIGLIISETFTSDGSSTLASGIFVTQTLVGASGDTTSLTGTTFISAITTQTETESIANISQVEINEPFISDNLTGDITNAQTLLIVNAPTEGLSNFAIRVISGSVFFGGDLDVAGTTTTVGRIKTVTRQTTTYTVLVTDSVVFGNTDSAGFTATLPAGVSGQTLRIINSGSSGNQLTVAPDGAEDLLGVNSSFTLFDGESLDITFDSTDGWY